MHTASKNKLTRQPGLYVTLIEPYKSDAQACQIYSGENVTCIYAANDVILALSINFSP